MERLGAYYPEKLDTGAPTLSDGGISRTQYSPMTGIRYICNCRRSAFTVEKGNGAGLLAIRSISNREWFGAYLEDVPSNSGNALAVVKHGDSCCYTKAGIVKSTAEKRIRKPQCQISR